MLLIRNRQRKRRIDLRLLSRMTRAVLRDLLALEAFELAVCIVGEAEMTRLNGELLRHEGSTDVITLDYGRLTPEGALVGEIFVCVEEALNQAGRFRTTWQSELARYVVHGALHLVGHDDHEPAARKAMKQEENRLLRRLDTEFGLAKLAIGDAVKIARRRI